MVRFKNRYFIIEIHSSEKDNQLSLVLSSGEIYRLIVNKVEQLHGDFGSAAMRCGFSAKYCNPQTHVALLRVRHGPHRFLATSLPFITAIRNKAVHINTLYTGCTMKQCFKFLKRYQQSRIERDLQKFKNTPKYDELCRQYLNIAAVATADTF